MSSESNSQPIRIYDGNILLQTITRILSCTIRDSLDGEYTLSFSTLADRAGEVQTGLVAEWDGNYFNIVRVAKTIQSGLFVCTVTCEHVSYLLSEDAYSLEEFSFTGNPAVGLGQLLAGTQFSAGTVDYTENCTMQINTTVTRRAALMQYVAILGGEIEYDGYRINILEHRGSTALVSLMEGKNVTSVGVTYDSRSVTASYEIAFFKLTDLHVGDEVSIVFAPLGINIETRIISLEYNPFWRYDIRVEVGDYTPTINDSLYQLQQSVEQASTDLDEFKNSYMEVDNLSISDDAFTVSYTDGTNATYSYTIDEQGRITEISRMDS